MTAMTQETIPYTHLNVIRMDDLHLGYVPDKNGRHYLPIRPVCRLLGVNYNHQRELINSHPVLSSVVREMQIPAWGRRTGPKPESMHSHSSGSTTPIAHDEESEFVMQRRRALCLPDTHYLGWLTSLPTRDVSTVVQWKLFFKLLEHIQGPSSQLRPFIARRKELENKRDELLQKLADDRTYQELLEVDRSLSQTKTEISNAQKRRLKQAELELQFPELPSRS